MGKGTEILLRKAYEHFNRNEFGDAVNMLNEILKTDSRHIEAASLRDQAALILKYSNTDVYSSTNLFMDPWEE